MMPTTVPAALQMPAMWLAEPFGFGCSGEASLAATYRSTTRPSASSMRSVSSVGDEPAVAVGHRQPQPGAGA